MSTGSSNMDPPQSDAFEWRPTELIRPRAQGTHVDRPESSSELSPFALIVLNQPLHTHLGVVRSLWDNAQVRVAADGGANCLYQAAGQHGDASFDDLRVIIGDLDSLTPETQAYYESEARHIHTGTDTGTGTGTGTRTKTQIIRDPDQESTDFGKAVSHVRTHYTTPAAKPLDIVAVGGLGGRVDQGLSQLHHLYLFQTSPDYAEGRVYLFSGESLTFLLKPGRHRIRVRDGPAGEDDVFGKYVGILPVGGTSMITTRGLEWDVADWETRFGGRMSTSNHVLPGTEVVEVETTGEVLWTIALNQV